MHTDLQTNISTLRGFTGILPVDKPVGVTSHDVVYWARKQTGVAKIGHSGTLDPLASGLLLLLIGKKFTVQQSSFLHLDKQYEVTANFGYISDTYDCEGVLQRQNVDSLILQLNEKVILKSLHHFLGSIQQQVPIFSAVKVRGKKLYEHARSGNSKPPTLPIKEVNIHAFTVQKFSLNVENVQATARFRIQCSSGTYIRSLIHDLGQDLGVGAVVGELRRIAIGQISIANAQLCPRINKKQFI